jgi:hypothetical protein
MMITFFLPLSKTDYLTATATTNCFRSGKAQSSLIVLSFNVQNIKFPDGNTLCKDWLTGYSLSNAIVYSTAVLIVVLNQIIVLILGCKIYV